jgi:hypothetical protein
VTAQVAPDAGADAVLLPPETLRAPTNYEADSAGRGAAILNRAAVPRAGASPPQLGSPCRSAGTLSPRLAMLARTRSVVFSWTCAQVRELARELPMC